MPQLRTKEPFSHFATQQSSTSVQEAKADEEWCWLNSPAPQSVQSSLVYARNIEVVRRAFFKRNWPDKFHSMSSVMRVWLKDMCADFFRGCQQIKHFELAIAEDDRQELKTKKINITRNLLNTLMNGVIEAVTHKELPQGFDQILHMLCKHGAFLSEGVLSAEEMEFCCFSSAHGYCRMDRQLEKVQLLHLFFIKILVYNVIFLHYHKLSEIELDHEDSYNAYNIFFIGSLFYHLCIDSRRAILSGRLDSSLYPLGNFHELREKVVCCSSLKSGGNVGDGELISGLMGRRSFEGQFGGVLEREKGLILASVDSLHNKIRRVHGKIKAMARRFR